LGARLVYARPVAICRSINHGAICQLRCGAASDPPHCSSSSSSSNRSITDADSTYTACRRAIAEKHICTGTRINRRRPAILSEYGVKGRLARRVYTAHILEQWVESIGRCPGSRYQAARAETGRAHCRSSAVHGCHRSMAADATAATGAGRPTGRPVNRSNGRWRRKSQRAEFQKTSLIQVYAFHESAVDRTIFFATFRLFCELFSDSRCMQLVRGRLGSVSKRQRRCTPQKSSDILDVESSYFLKQWQAIADGYLSSNSLGEIEPFAQGLRKTG